MHDLRRTYRSRNGFTIVELLVIIMVLGILISIAVVSYNGVQQRARVTTGQSDLQNLSDQMELYRVNNGQYPTVGSQFGQILVGAGLYEATRNTPTPAEKSFVFCRANDGSENFAIVAWYPVTVAVSGGETTGTPVYFIERDGILGEAPYIAKPAGFTTALAACRSVHSRYDSVNWSFNVSI